MTHPHKIISGAMFISSVVFLLFLVACADGTQVANNQTTTVAPTPAVDVTKLTRPRSRVEQWRDAARYGVAWVGGDEILPSTTYDGIDDLPDALPYGTIIETEGPIDDYNILGCRAIFIIGQPPMRDSQGRNTEIWTRGRVQVPRHIDGEYVWKFNSFNCSPWKIVKLSEGSTQRGESALSSEPPPISRLNFVESNIRKEFPSYDTICDTEIIDRSEIIVCEVSDDLQYMYLLGVYDVDTGATLKSYSGNYIYDGGIMTICHGATNCNTEYDVSMTDFVRKVGLERQRTAESLRKW